MKVFFLQKKCLINHYKNEWYPIQIRPPGPWFDKVGTIIGATYDEAMEVLDPAQGLEDCLHHILLRTRNIIPEEKLSTIPSGDDDCSIESKRMKRDVGDYDEPELD